jgi:hypothetical protein
MNYLKHLSGILHRARPFTPGIFSIITLAGAVSALYGNPEFIKPAPVREINFDIKGDVEFITDRELRIWAANRNLALIGDCPYRNLDDGIAAVIPHYGLEFELDSAGNQRQFLYLDMATYMPLSHYDESRAEGYCRPSLKGETHYGRASGFDLPVVRWLEILINGHKAGLVYMGAGAFLNTPLVIPVEREDLVRGKIHVLLKPSTGDAYFAIWDAFISTHPPEQ